jgi:hypothetical protein
MVLIALLALISKEASAQIGPPLTRTENGGYSLGLGMQNVSSRWLPYDYQVDRNRVYLEGSHGLDECFEIFARAGGSNMVINEVESWQPGYQRDVSSDGYPLFGSLGVRGCFYGGKRWSFGAALEVALYSGMDKTIRWKQDVFQEIRFDPASEINAGLSVGYQIGRSTIYGGPLIHFGYTRADTRTHYFGSNWSVDDEIDALTVRDKASVGSFLGWQTPLGENGWNLLLEGSTISEGFGGAIAFFRSW